MKRIFIRPELCTGCKTCELACGVARSQTKSIHTSPFESLRPVPRIFVEAANGHKVPTVCRQCDDAPCMAACIAGALSRDSASGAIRCDWNRCVGCWTCIMVCPFGVVTRQVQAGKALKCDLCAGRDGPACVAACPTKALVFEEVETFGKGKRREFAAAVAGG